MLRVNNIVKVLALSTVMFGAGATVATVALSYLPMVNASSTKIAQGSKQSKPEEIDEKNGLKFQFQDCKRGTKIMICNVLVTNFEKDNQLLSFQYIGGSSKRARIVDVDGNQYIGIQLLNGKELESSQSSTNLISGIPTKLTFKFEIPTEVTKLVVLEVNYIYPYAAKDGKVALRDITIGGSQASNPANPENCTCPPQTNPKKPRPR
jgi:hypothetical protein